MRSPRCTTEAASSANLAPAGGPQVMQVLVLDWDDCLRDHQALNYQLLHNAVALAAEECADKFPEIGDALARLNRGMQDGRGDLEKEIRHLGMNRYFDVVSGSPLVTQPKADAASPLPLPLPSMPDELQQRLTGSLGGSDTNPQALRAALDEAAAYAHPDTTKVHWSPTKPDAQRLRDSLAFLGVPPDVPIVSYGDQVTDVQQLARLARPGDPVRKLEGVIVNRQRPDVGRQIEVEGIPTRVLSSFEDH